MKEPQVRLGPFTVAVLGLAAIAIGASIKTGYIKIGRGGAPADSGVSVKTGAGDVILPTASPDQP